MKLPLLIGLLVSPVLAPQGPPTSVRTEPVRESELQERRLVNGNVRARRRSDVASEEGGRVVGLEVDEGVRVAGGAVLARLDASRLELELAVLEAQEAAAAALVTERDRSLDQEQRDLEAVRRLVERAAANEKELKDAETALAEAEARLEAARAERMVLAARVALLRRRIADMEIRAPFAGTIASVHTELGQWVPVGATIATLVSDDVEVWLEVPQRQLAATRDTRGALAVHVGEGGPAIDVTDWRVVPVVAASTRAFTVVAELPEDAAAVPGMSATAWLPVGSRTRRATVPVDALMRNELGAYLFVATPAGDGQPWSARPVQVEILWRESGRAVVAGPVRDGDAAIVEGKERLYPMAPVQPVEPDPGR